MTRSCVVLAGAIFALSGLGFATTAGRADPINITHYMIPFGAVDHWGHCSDPRLTLERRVEHCKSLLGTGRGPADDIELWTEIGDAYRSAQQYAPALDAYDQALHAHGDEDHRFAARNGEDETLALSGHYDQALADADKLLGDERNSARAYNNRCWVRAVAGKDFEAALADCNEALKLESDNVLALDSRGLVEFKLGQVKKALADYDAVLDKDPKFPSSLFMRGIIELKDGNADDGNADIAAAKERDPQIEAEFAAYGVSR